MSVLVTVTLYSALGKETLKTPLQMQKKPVVFRKVKEEKMEKIAGGKDTLCYLGDTHREALDRLGETLKEKPTTRGLRSLAVRHLIEEHQKGERR